MYLYIKCDLPYCERVDRYSKSESIQFENISIINQEIIDSFRTVEDFNLFRLNLFNYIKTKVKCEFIKVSEDENGVIKEKQGFRLSSDIFRIDDNTFAKCLPYYIRKQYFGFSTRFRKYYQNSNLILKYRLMEYEC